MQIISAMFTAVLELTLTMSAVIAVVLLFTKLAGGRFKLGCRYVIWLLVALRLALPVNFTPFEPLIRIDYSDAGSEAAGADDASASAFLQAAEQTAPSQEPFYMPLESFVPAETATAVPETAPRSFSEPLETAASVKKAAPSEPEPVRSTAELPAFSLGYIASALPAVWLEGAVLYFMLNIFCYLGLAGRIRRSGLEAPGADTLLYYHMLCRDMGITREPRLMCYQPEVNRCVTGPMMLGYFRPTILIPKPDGESGSLLNEKILRHELTHCMRRDLWCKLLFMTAESVHWFNPLVRVGMRRAVCDMELSCDENVLRNADADERQKYGQAMLDVMRSGRRTPAPLTTHFRPTAKTLRERFSFIMDTGKRRAGFIVVAAILVLVLTAGLVISIGGGRGERGEKIDYEKAYEGYFLQYGEVLAKMLYEDRGEGYTASETGRYIMRDGKLVELKKTSGTLTVELDGEKLTAEYTALTDGGSYRTLYGERTGGFSYMPCLPMPDGAEDAAHISVVKMIGRYAYLSLFDHGVYDVLVYDLKTNKWDYLGDSSETEKLYADAARIAAESAKPDTYYAVCKARYLAEATAFSPDGRRVVCHVSNEAGGYASTYRVYELGSDGRATGYFDAYTKSYASQGIMSSDGDMYGWVDDGLLRLYPVIREEGKNARQPAFDVYFTDGAVYSAEVNASDPKLRSWESSLRGRFRVTPGDDRLTLADIVTGEEHVFDGLALYGVYDYFEEFFGSTELQFAYSEESHFAANQTFTRAAFRGRGGRDVYILDLERDVFETRPASAYIEGGVISGLTFADEKTLKLNLYYRDESARLLDPDGTEIVGGVFSRTVFISCGQLTPSGTLLRAPAERLRGELDRLGGFAVVRETVDGALDGGKLGKLTGTVKDIAELTFDMLYWCGGSSTFSGDFGVAEPDVRALFADILGGVTLDTWESGSLAEFFERLDDEKRLTELYDFVYTNVSEDFRAKFAEMIHGYDWLLVPDSLRRHAAKNVGTEYKITDYPPAVTTARPVQTEPVPEFTETPSASVPAAEVVTTRRSTPGREDAVVIGSDVHFKHKAECPVEPVIYAEIYLREEYELDGLDIVSADTGRKSGFVYFADTKAYSNIKLACENAVKSSYPSGTGVTVSPNDDDMDYLKEMRSNVGVTMFVYDVKLAGGDLDGAALRALSCYDKTSGCTVVVLLPAENYPLSSVSVLLGYLKLFYATETTGDMYPALSSLDGKAAYSLSDAFETSVSGMENVEAFINAMKRGTPSTLNLIRYGTHAVYATEPRTIADMAEQKIVWAAEMWTKLSFDGQKGTYVSYEEKYDSRTNSFSTVETGSGSFTDIEEYLVYSLDVAYQRIVVRELWLSDGEERMKLCALCYTVDTPKDESAVRLSVYLRYLTPYPLEWFACHTADDYRALGFDQRAVKSMHTSVNADSYKSRYPKEVAAFNAEFEKFYTLIETGIPFVSEVGYQYVGVDFPEDFKLPETLSTYAYTANVTGKEFAKLYASIIPDAEKLYGDELTQLPNRRAESADEIISLLADVNTGFFRYDNNYTNEGLARAMAESYDKVTYNDAVERAYSIAGLLGDMYGLLRLDKSYNVSQPQKLDYYAFYFVPQDAPKSVYSEENFRGNSEDGRLLIAMYDNGKLVCLTNGILTGSRGKVASHSTEGISLRDIEVYLMYQTSANEINTRLKLAAAKVRERITAFQQSQVAEELLLVDENGRTVGAFLGDMLENLRGFAKQFDEN